MLIEQGQKYRFDPPVVATGFQGEGDKTKQFPQMSFATGSCVRLGTHAHQFRATVAGQDYMFFVLMETSGSKFTPLA